MGFSAQNYRGKAKKRARKFALEWLGYGVDSNMPYCEVATNIAKNDTRVLLEGIDLSNEESAKSFILAWSEKNGIRHH